MRDKFHFIFLFLMALALTPSVVVAQNARGQIKFGTENELRNSLMYLQPSPLYGAINYATGKIIFAPIDKHDFYTKRMQSRYLEAMKRVCQTRGDCRVEGNRVIYPSRGFDFSITLDATTLELIHKPITTAEMKELLPIIQQDMFDLPASLGLKVSNFDLIGAGHLHIDIEDAFGADALLFRNFVVDYLNHWELYSGILGNDPLEAKDILKNQRTHDSYSQVIADFDSGRIHGLEDLRSALVKIGFKKITRTTQKPALNLETKYKTLELRGIRSYRGARQMLLIMQLFENRIRYLKTLSHPVPILAYRPFSGSPESEVVRFYSYVTKAELEWEDYVGLIPARYQAHRFDAKLERWMTPPSDLRCFTFLLGLRFS